MARAALVCAALVASCGAQARAPSPPSVAASATAQASPDASAAKTPEQVAAEKTPEEIAAHKDCATETHEANMALCYLRSDSEASIDPLFSLGRSDAEKAARYGDWHDVVFDAEGAGTLAAKTQPNRLYAVVEHTDEVDQFMGVVALRSMLATLRYGHAHGKDADDDVRKQRLARAHAACLAKIDAQSVMLATAALDCLREAHDPADMSTLVGLGTSNAGVAIQAHALQVAADIGGPCATATLLKLAPLLERPISNAPPDTPLVGSRRRGVRTRPSSSARCAAARASCCSRAARRASRGRRRRRRSRRGRSTGPTRASGRRARTWSTRLDRARPGRSRRRRADSPKGTQTELTARRRAPGA